MLNDTAIVVIARNEGDRLKACLASTKGQAKYVIYSDSGSTDGSAEHARSVGVEVTVIERPYNQPRGRNAGFRRLLELDPNLKYVFFMDGDCLLVPGFLERARQELENNPTLAAVCGRRLELKPHDTPYNTVVHLEWNTPVGSRDCGGDVLMRVDVMKQVGGYQEGMVSGEDFEICHRMRKLGFETLRIEADMTKHDVALKSFKKWWWRHARGGYSFAHLTALNLDNPDWTKIKLIGSAMLWGLAVPFGAVVLAPVTLGASLSSYAAANGVLFYRIRKHRIKDLHDDPSDASTYATYILIGKFAEVHGIAWFLWRYLRGEGITYFDYKDLNKQQPQPPKS